MNIKQSRFKTHRVKMSGSDEGSDFRTPGCVS